MSTKQTEEKISKRHHTWMTWLGTWAMVHWDCYKTSPWVHRFSISEFQQKKLTNSKTWTSGRLFRFSRHWRVRMGKYWNIDITRLTRKQAVGFWPVTRERIRTNYCCWVSCSRSVQRNSDLHFIIHTARFEATISQSIKNKIYFTPQRKKRQVNKVNNR